MNWIIFINYMISLFAFPTSKDGSDLRAIRLVMSAITFAIGVACTFKAMGWIA